jgi:acetolactate synthase-1/2/3 large subunit
MKKTGAKLVVHALEEIGIKYTFGIPGVHNTEIYDELNNSEKITPILVTHEGGAAFMAIGVSATSEQTGTLVIVPAAGTTNAMSGIGEAFLDGIPMLIISGGTRKDSGRSYQLHQMNQGNLVNEITKGYFLISTHKEIIPSIYKAYQLATEGEPGPVFVEIPVEIQMFQGEVSEMPSYQKPQKVQRYTQSDIEKAVELLLKAKNPGIYVGWGAAEATKSIIEIAEKLNAPVSTTLQGKASFPASHPLHTGFGFGANSVPASQKAFKNCDAMLAVGVRFSEIGTGSFGAVVPENLIHIDINPEVFHKNYPAKITLEGDSFEICEKIAQKLKNSPNKNSESINKLQDLIKTEKLNYVQTWKKEKQNQKVSPGFFFEALNKLTSKDSIFIVDDGNHTYLATELLSVDKSRHFVSPTDFNCMGFCVPAAIGAKMANPNKQVIGIVGDGGFLMTGMEMLTAVMYEQEVVYFVFNDGELGQISQFQKIPLNRKTATVLGQFNIKGIADACGAEYLLMPNDFAIDETLKKAFDIAKQQKKVVVVDVVIDYSKKTNMTKGVVMTNLGRFSFSEKVRFISRAIKRQIFG